MGKREERQKRILDLLMGSEVLSVHALAKQLGVTTETIRTDLDAMEKLELITRGHGFARANRKQIEMPFEQRVASNTEAKKVVAWRAIQEIQDGMVVYLDTGTTMYAGLDLLRSKRDLTIVTNSLNVAEIGLDMDFEVLLVGGVISKKGKRCSGYFAEQMLKQIHFDLAIIGADGLKDLTSFGVGLPDEIGWERQVVESASRVILIADSSKFDLYTVYTIGTFEEIDLLITNFIDDKLREQITEKVELIETDGQKDRITPKKQKVGSVAAPIGNSKTSVG